MTLLKRLILSLISFLFLRNKFDYSKNNDIIKDMQVPRRKSDKYTHLKTDPHLTEEKFLELKSKLERLKNACPRLIEEVKRLAQDGDFSENAAYQIAKGRLRGVNQGILEIENQLKRAIIIKPQKNAETVQLGSTVTVEVKGKIKNYLILGSAETNPEKGIISHHSPIGSALMGRRMGAKINLQIAGKTVEYKIIKIA